MEIPHFWSATFKTKFGYRWSVVRCVLAPEGITIGEIAKGWTPFKMVSQMQANRVLDIILKSLGGSEVITEKE